MGVTTKDGKHHQGDVTDAHDGYVRVKEGSSVKVFPKSDVKEMWGDVKDVPNDDKK